MPRRERTPEELYRGKRNSLRWLKITHEVSIASIEKEISLLREAAQREGIEE